MTSNMTVATLRNCEGRASARVLSVIPCDGRTPIW